MRLQGSLGFYSGLFVSAAVILSLQILHTRILSVSSWYFLAFFAISMAMFGMTAGSLIVYFRSEELSGKNIAKVLGDLAVYLSLANLLSWFLLINNVIAIEFSVMAALGALHLILILVLPYVIGGMLVSLALTRSPYPVGRVYAVDLAGAAAGCLIVLAIMWLIDGVSALLATSAMAALAAVLFRGDAIRSGSRPTGLLSWAGTITALFALAAVGNALIYPNGARLIFTKNEIVSRHDLEATRWNSFSRIDVSPMYEAEPYMWGPSEVFPGERFANFPQRMMRIDGQAGTPIYRFTGQREEVQFLEYDLTNLAYRIRNQGTAAVIGVGGGRDLLSAYYFGFKDIVGVEINPIIIDNLKNRYANFNTIASLPEVELVVDEARSWFARTDRSFDLIQMSLIDTWAATGVGAFSLTENGLYTVEGWMRFLDRLKPNGVFTVSRWFSPQNLGETGRIAALAKATLFRLGANDPNQHIFLAAAGRLSTIVVSRRPLSPAELGILQETAEEMRFEVLFAPGLESEDPVLRQVWGAGSEEQLNRLGDSLLNFAPPTDDSPFFFNQLRFGAIPTLLFSDALSAPGVARGNLQATAVLAVLIVASGLAVFCAAVIPTLPVLRRVSGTLASCGTAYFLMIGLGFMFVEIALMQRLSIFLGHPVYGVAIGLAGIILATGIGSMLSDRLRLDTTWKIAAWSLGTAAYLFATPYWLPGVVAAMDGSGIVLRAMTSLATIMPVGLLLGFGFPTGMRLVNAIDGEPTPWFWAVNGAAGVLASGIAVAVGTFVSINASFTVAAFCYMLILPAAVGLKRLASRHQSAFRGEWAGDAAPSPAASTQAAS